MSESPALRRVGDRVKAGMSVNGVFYGPSSSTAGGYHQTRDRLIALGRDGDYSITLADDKAGPGGRWCAIDVTGEAATRTLTARFRDAVNRRDPRVACLREVLGSLDNKSTVRYTHSSPSGAWSIGTPPDSSHLWHVHLSLFRRYADDLSIVDGLVQVALNQPAPEENVALTASDITKIAEAVWAKGTTNPARKDANGNEVATNMGAMLRWAEAQHWSSRDASIAATRGEAEATRAAIRAEGDRLIAAIAAQTGITDAQLDVLADAVADRLAGIGGVNYEQVRQASRLAVADVLRIGTDNVG